MTTRFIGTWLALLLCTKYAALEAQQWRYVAIQGEILPHLSDTTPLEINLEVDTHPGEEFYCIPPPAGPRSLLCVAEVPSETRYVRMTVFRPGYKRYWRNLPALNFRGGDTAIIRLQPIQLELPKIRTDPVIVSMEGDTAYRFQFTFRNRFTRDTLQFREMSISAYTPRNTFCLMGEPYEIYEVRPTINIYAQTGAVHQFSGRVKERKGRPEAATPVEGSFTFESCSSMTALTMRMPLRIELPAGSARTIDLVFPVNFRVTSQQWSREPRRQSARGIRCIIDALSHLSEFSFVIRTNSIEEPEINIGLSFSPSRLHEQPLQSNIDDRRDHSGCK